MNRTGYVYFRDTPAGTIEESDSGYIFSYYPSYLENGNPPVSFTLPLRSEPYQSKTFFPFFDGLIPEGWLLDIAESTWKISRRDRMSLLLACCKDCIGAVSVRAEK